MEEKAQKGKVRFKPLIGVPPFRQGVTHPDILFDLLAIAKQGWLFLRMESQRIDTARNTMAHALLNESDFTHLLMLDADQRHRPDLVWRLGRRVADDPARLVVSALYHRRGPPYEPLAFMEAEDGRIYQIEPTTSGIGKVDYLGTGCMLVAREVFERIPEPWFMYDYPAPGKYPSEDMWFSRQCKKAGIDLWLDTTIESLHHGVKWIGSDDWKASLAENPWSVLFYEVGIMENPGTVLYVGARPKPECSKVLDYLAVAGATIDILEIWPENCEGFADDERVRHVICGDVRGDLFKDVRGGIWDTVWAENGYFGYDWIVWWHGPEHIERTELDQVLADLGSMSDHILLGCPWGHYEQGAIYGNPHEEHLTHWQPEEFEELGFTVRAVGKDGKGNIIAWR